MLDARHAERQVAIGKNIRTIARNRGVSIRSIAGRLDVSEQQTYARLRGVAKFSIGELDDIAEMLNCSVVDMLRDPADLLGPPSAWNELQPAC